MAHHRKHSKISSEPADATRREGPAPDFEFVRPYVASIAEQPAELPGRPAPADATAELTLRLLTVRQRPAVPETDDGPARRSRARYLLLAAAMVLILIAAGVFVFRSPHTAPADASSQPAPTASTAPVGAIATVDAPTSEPTSEPTAVPTDTSTSTTTTTTTTHTGSPQQSTDPSPRPSPDRPSGVAGTTVVASGQIVGIGGMCVDDNGRVTPNGNPIQLYGCNATPAQAWAYMGDGTLRVLGKCLQVTQPAQAGLAELWDCDGSPTEVWRGGPGHEFVNVATGLCLDSPNLSSAQGTQLQIWQCNGGTNQSWVFQ